MSEREQIVSNLNECWDSFTALADSLNEDQWKVQSHCPDWDVRGVVIHLMVVEQMLAGWLPDPNDSDAPLPFERIGPAMEAANALSNAELVEQFKSTLDERRGQLANSTDELFDTPSMTPVGKATYGRFMAIREFDAWMHERDCRTPLDLPVNNGGPAAEMALDEVHMSIGYIAGKRIGVPEGASMHFEITGACQRDIFVQVDGRAGEVEALANPTATLHCDSLAFMELACGRVDPQERIDAGLVSWSGDPELGERAARNLRFTM